MPGECFPGGRDLIPALLTPTEAVRVLRLDIVTNGDGEVTIRAPADSLRSLRRIPGLHPHRFAKGYTYSRSDLLRLINSDPS